MKSFFLLIFSLVFITINGQDPVAVTSRISDVTVFLSGAQVSRSASLNLESGGSQLLFDNLPANINAQSIQVEGKGNFTILAVSHRIDYLQSPAKSKEIKQLQDSLLLLQDQLSNEKAALASYQEQEDLLKANRQIGGSNTGVNVNDLKIASEYIRTTILETGRQKIRINRNISLLNEKVSRINNQLGTLKASNPPTSEILVSVNANARTSGTLRVSYLVTDAGWTPEYDLRAINVSNPIDITYKAGVFQSSGESWDKVSLSLSTGNPSQNGTKPELRPWFLNYYVPVQLMDKKMSIRGVSSKGEMPMAFAKEESSEDLAEASSLSGYTSVVEAQTTTEYNISIPTDIPSDGQPHEVEIKKVSLPASYAYYCVPKSDPDAFLVARVSGWEDLNLLSGPMNLYFEGTFVGQSQLDAASTKDTLEISMGRDKNINVKRERMKDFTSKQVIGGNRKDVRGFEITVRNRKKQDIDILVEDQVPVTTNREIEVETTEITGGNLDKNSGKLVWKFNLPAGGSKSIKMVYTVKYPKDKQVILE